MVVVAVWKINSAKVIVAFPESHSMGYELRYAETFSAYYRYKLSRGQSVNEGACTVLDLVQRRTAYCLSMSVFSHSRRTRAAALLNRKLNWFVNLKCVCVLFFFCFWSQMSVCILERHRLRTFTLFFFSFCFIVLDPTVSDTHHCNY